MNPTVIAAAVAVAAAVAFALSRQDNTSAPDAGFLPSFDVPDFLTDGGTEPPPAWAEDAYTPAEVAGVPLEGDSQLPGVIDSTMNYLDFTNTSTTAGSANDANVRAFLDMIAYAEGTAMAEGYRVMFGYPKNPDRLITSFADHPRQYFTFTVGGKTLKTSAAGRYQFLASTWDDLKSKLGLVDFSPASQDAACIELIRQRGALGDVRAGRTVTAINKCAKTWASLPGAGYGQPERAIASLLNQYAAAGGTTLTA
jgi:lysozyme